LDLHLFPTLHAVGLHLVFTSNVLAKEYHVAYYSSIGSGNETSFWLARLFLVNTNTALKLFLDYFFE